MTALPPLPGGLEKRIRDRSGLARRATRAAIAAGRVAVDGAIVRDAERLVYPDEQLALDGQPLEARADAPTFLLHKPTGVTTTTRDPLARGDLAPLLASLPRGSQPVGRLDRDSSGALLVTADGDLANAVLRPQNRVPKVYRLVVDGQLSEEDPRIATMRAGIDSAIGKLTVAALTVEGPAESDEPHSRPQGTATALRVTLTSGKNRHLRRMCYAAGLRLRALHRLSVGPVALGALPAGEARALDAGERDALWEAAGGRARVWRLQREALAARAAAARASGAPDARLEAFLAG